MSQGLNEREMTYQLSIKKVKKDINCVAIIAIKLLCINY